MRKMLGIATAVTVYTCGAPAAAAMTNDEYKAGKVRITAEYQADRQKCGAGYGNAIELCIARARGAQKVAKAELEAAHKPSPRSNYDAAIARANVAYRIAKEECDDKKGAPRQGCEKDAKAEHERATATAKTAMKAANAGR
jgi:hypothetical protein